MSLPPSNQATPQLEEQPLEKRQLARQQASLPSVSTSAIDGVSIQPLLSLEQVSHHFQAGVARAHASTPPVAQRPTATESHLAAALNQINLQIYPGDRLALIGPSGAGKSTVLRLLNGSLMPTQGQVKAFGSDWNQLSQRRRRRLQRQIGTVYQQFHLVGSLRVIHNVNAGHLGRWPLLKALFSLAIPQGLEQASQALEQVGIAEKLFERTDQLSGGQQQRVAIARVLIQNPQVILADEPIASLDPERSREVMRLLKQLCGDAVESEIEPATTSEDVNQRELIDDRRALVVSLHDLEMAREWCDRIVGLRSGEILFDCAADALTQAQVDELYRI